MKLVLRVFALLALFGVISSTTLAQSEADRSAKSGEIVDKIRELDLMNHILPIIYTKEQLNLMLPAIEKARQNVKMTQEAEYKVLLSIEKQIDTALNKALVDGVPPGKQILVDLEKYFEVMNGIRQNVGHDNEDLVYKVINDNCNSGQKKAIANSLDPHAINPQLQTDKMTDEEKERFYIRNILLDPLAYNLLVKLSRASTTPDK